MSSSTSTQAEFEWKQTRTRISSTAVKIEPPSALTEAASSEKKNRTLVARKPSSSSMQLTEAELARLRSLARRPPATRTYDEVRSLLYLLRGGDLLLPLDEDGAAVVAASVRLHEYRKGDVIATEANAGDAFVLLVRGLLSVLVRDLTAKAQRGVLLQIVPGEVAAEAQLVDHAVLAPSLVAAEAVTILRVSNSDFFASYASWQLELQERRLGVLQAVPCLTRFDARLLRPLAERTTQERVHANAVVLKQGEETHRMCIIASGECRVLVRTGGGQIIEAQTLGPGAICGEVGKLLDGGKHAASIVSSADVTLLALQRSDLLAAADAQILATLRASDAQLAVPEEGELLRQLRLADHWAACRVAIAQTCHAELASQKINPTQPPERSSAAKPPASKPPLVAADRVVRDAFIIAPDGTPASKLDAGDLQARLRRREAEDARRRAKGGVVSKPSGRLAAYLATRPGGALWRGNGPLRTYVKHEERRQLQRSLSRVGLSLPRLGEPGGGGRRRPGSPDAVWAADGLLDDDGALDTAPSEAAAVAEARAAQGRVGQVSPPREPPSLKPPRVGKEVREQPLHNQLRHSLPELRARRHRTGAVSPPPDDVAVDELSNMVVSISSPTLARQASSGIAVSAAAAAATSTIGDGSPDSRARAVSFAVSAAGRGGTKVLDVPVKVPMTPKTAARVELGIQPSTPQLGSCASAPSLAYSNASSRAARLEFAKH